MLLLLMKNVYMLKITRSVCITGTCSVSMKINTGRIAVGVGIVMVVILTMMGLSDG